MMLQQLNEISDQKNTVKKVQFVPVLDRDRCYIENKQKLKQRACSQLLPM